MKLVENLWAVGAPPRTALWEGNSQRAAYSWWRGLLVAAHPQEPQPRSRASALRSPRPYEKSWPRPCSLLKFVFSCSVTT